jgi:hypothetical protein
MPFITEIWPNCQTSSEGSRALEQRTFFARGGSPLTSKDRMHCEGQRGTGRFLTSKDNETRRGHCPFDDTRFIVTCPSSSPCLDRSIEMSQ